MAGSQVFHRLSQAELERLGLGTRQNRDGSPWLVQRTFRCSTARSNIRTVRVDVGCNGIASAIHEMMRVVAKWRLCPTAKWWHRMSAVLAVATATSACSGGNVGLPTNASGGANLSASNVVCTPNSGDTKVVVTGVLRPTASITGFTRLVASVFDSSHTQIGTSSQLVAISPSQNSRFQFGVPISAVPNQCKLHWGVVGPAP